MIQQNINQLLSTTAILGRLAPGYEKRVEARDILGKARSAKAGLEAIESGLKEPGKKFSETELKDIKSRTAELNRNIYSAKIRAKEGDPLSRYLRKGVSQLPHQEEYTQTLQSIESWHKKAMQKLNTRQDVRDLRQSIILGSNAKPLEVPVEKEN